MSETKVSEWAKPKEIDPVTAAFPANVAGHLLPPMNEIPKEFQDWNEKWNRVVSKWFYGGLEPDALKVKPEINRSMAIRHLSAILRSFEPKHEHKTAGAAYLMSLWFDSYEEPSPTGDGGAR